MQWRRYSFMHGNKPNLAKSCQTKPFLISFCLVVPSNPHKAFTPTVQVKRRQQPGPHQANTAPSGGADAVHEWVGFGIRPRWPLRISSVLVLSGETWRRSNWYGARMFPRIRIPVGIWYMWNFSSFEKSHAIKETGLVPILNYYFKLLDVLSSNYFSLSVLKQNLYVYICTYMTNLISAIYLILCLSTNGTVECYYCITNFFSQGNPFK